MWLNPAACFYGSRINTCRWELEILEGLQDVTFAPVSAVRVCVGAFAARCSVAVAGTQGLTLLQNAPGTWLRTGLGVFFPR